MSKTLKQHQHKPAAKEPQDELHLTQSIDTIEQAVDFLVRQLDEKAISALSSGTEREAQAKAWRALGMSVRAVFGLWDGTNTNLLSACLSENWLKMPSRCIKVDHASGVILDALVKRLRAEDESSTR
jgi:hypothetical protein